MPFHFALSQNSILRQKKSTRGVIIRARRNTYPRGALEKNSKKTFSKKSHSAENDSFSPFPIFIHGTELYPILIHWAELYPILKNWAELYPMLIHWTELYPILIHCRTIPYLNTLSRTIPYLNTWSRIHSDFGSSSRQPMKIEHEKAFQLRQPIRIE